MPSFQSIALLAVATTASANYLSGNYEFVPSDIVARDLYNDIDSLIQHYQRDLEGDDYTDGQFMIREAKGGAAGAGRIASSAFKGAGKGATAFGNVGTGLTGISDVVNLFKGNGGNNGNGKRDLEGYYEDSELLGREAARLVRPSAASVGHAVSSAGRGASSGAEAFGHVGDGLTGISNIVNLFKGGNGKGKRDLDDLYEGLTIYAREPKGRSGSPKSFLSSLSQGHGSLSSSPSSSSQASSGHGHGFGSLIQSANAAGHGVGHAVNAFGRVGDGLSGISDVVNSLRGNSNNNKRDLEALLDAADEIIAREEMGFEDDY